MNISERSFICKKEPNGKWRYIWCHRVCAEKLKQYNSAELVDALLDLGDIAYIYDADAIADVKWQLVRAAEYQKTKPQFRDTKIRGVADRIYYFENGEWSCRSRRGRIMPLHGCGYICAYYYTRFCSDWARIVENRKEREEIWNS
jgi:hypothetical protein